MASARSADVMVVALERVERLRVEEPMTTRLLDSPDPVDTGAEDVRRLLAAATSVEVAIREVMVLPSELVVVISTEVGIRVELSRDDPEDVCEDA